MCALLEDRMLRPVFEWQVRRGEGRTRFARLCALVLALFLSFGWPAQSTAYAVLAHEAIIDSIWDTNIRPLLLKRFPNATKEELKETHGYAYGGGHYSGHGLLPARKLFLQRLDALCAERGLCPGSAARRQGP